MPAGRSPSLANPQTHLPIPRRSASHRIGWHAAALITAQAAHNRRSDASVLVSCSSSRQIDLRPSQTSTSPCRYPVMIINRVASVAACQTAPRAAIERASPSCRHSSSVSRHRRRPAGGLDDAARRVVGAKSLAHRLGEDRPDQPDGTTSADRLQAGLVVARSQVRYRWRRSRSSPAEPDRSGRQPTVV